MEKIILENKFFKVNISSFWAELKSIFSKKLQKNILWSWNPKYWWKTSPILFPIVWELKDGFYIFDWKKYFLSRHWFARDNDFEIIFSNKTKTTFSLKSTSETKKVFPFDFEFLVSYELVENKILINFEVKNLWKILYFSLWAHPAFSIENISNRQVSFSEDQNLERYFLDGWLINRHEKFLENEKSFWLSHELFDDDALVFKKWKNNWGKLFLENKKTHEKMIFDISQAQYLGIWSAKNSPFVCIEPWRGIADNINSDNDITKKEGIICLQEWENFSTSYSIQI